MPASTMEYTHARTSNPRNPPTGPQTGDGPPQTGDAPRTGGASPQTGDAPRDPSGRRPSIASYPPSVSFKNLGSRLQVDRNKKLGEGGFADVFMGVFDGKQCAVKVLKREMDEEQMREVKLMKELTAGGHPHIVELLAAGTCASSSLLPPGL